MSVSLIPETAPFTQEQRAWLNGFLAGWLGVSVNGNSASGEKQSVPSAVSALLSSAPPSAQPQEEELPWHDPSLPIGDRLQLADGKPLARRLMAAMAQLNCGACGYVCKTYSEAIAAGQEKNLSLCSPGGKETAKVLKQLLKEQPVAASNGSNGKPSDHSPLAPAIPSAEGDQSGFSRANPFSARLKSSAKLNGDGSAKHTSHVVIDLARSGLRYRVGDALGVYPINPPELVDEILGAARLATDFTVCVDGNRTVTLRDALLREYCLRSVSEEFLMLLARSADAADQQKIERALADDSWDQLDVLDALHLAPSSSLDAQEWLAHLSPLAPRLYSIASSLSTHPDEVHLTVGRVAYQQNGRQRLGVASTMFADRLSEGAEVRVFVHASSEFTIPADSTKPMIMVGPGTGVAPFRAFLQERQATRAAGKNWLFFGDQCEATDFLYREEFEGMCASGLLTRLDTAFSRDQSQKVYVQDRMRENGEELFSWLEAGAYFFVCGDARRMAVDVDRALHDVIACHGVMSSTGATEYIKELKQQKRYVRDVY